MPDCELIHQCIFFNNKMRNYPAIAELLKRKFCKGTFTTCARYMVYKVKGRASVPTDLFPPEIEKVEKIIRGG
ncbi:MAG: hypothetical protein PHX57_14195 [Desulfobulbaceae bacterium]|nr:hypothetical protein [Desulfobulbaceae bacterium]